MHSWTGKATQSWLTTVAASGLQRGRRLGGKHCSAFWPNFLKCDPLLVLSVFSQGVVFQEIRPKKRAMVPASLRLPAEGKPLTAQGRARVPHLSYTLRTPLAPH
jgi:hypothetical protein